ncbi:laminin subunit alpha-1-like [Helicoverpa zea]|uniref:laminin subunit alpha-1-like n=1 Tax=Helicoverpa zea TaxID=7113 RepID=UPI001F5775B1|nr:laminin subunit alpha-1-like [Helicoverpa zea]
MDPDRLFPMVAVHSKKISRRSHYAQAFPLPQITQMHSLFLHSHSPKGSQSEFGERSGAGPTCRALLDRLSSTTVGEVLTSGAASGLVPAPLDVAPYSTVTANATCGDAGAEEYCRDTPGKRGVVCDVCEGEGGPARRRHPAAHAHDGDPATWWQSPTLAAGDYQHVELLTTLPDSVGSRVHKDEVKRVDSKRSKSPSDEAR